MKKISIIGIGKLGLCFGLICEANGYHVMGCDVREDYVKQLNDKTFKTPEPEVETLLKKAQNLNVTTDIDEAIDFADLLFVFVPTPSLENGEYNHKYIDEVVTSLINHDGYIDVKTFIICCTVMPTYCESVQVRVKNVNVVYNPSFIAQGSICQNLKYADIVLIGCNKDGSFLDELQAVYNSIMFQLPDFKVMSLTAAEITKIGINCFLTTKISFANMIGEIAINSGEEKSVKSILNAIGSDSRIGNKFLNYGFGYSGLCLPRDNRALAIHATKIGVPNILPFVVDAFNKMHLLFLKDKFIKENPDKNVRFIFNQLSYKRGIDILTESQHYQLCKELLDEGYSVNIIESDAVIEMVKPELAKYGDKVIYGNGVGTYSRFPERLIKGQQETGYVIDL